MSYELWGAAIIGGIVGFVLPIIILITIGEIQYYRRGKGK